MLRTKIGIPAPAHSLCYHPDEKVDALYCGELAPRCSGPSSASTTISRSTMSTKSAAYLVAPWVCIRPAGDRSFFQSTRGAPP